MSDISSPCSLDEFLDEITGSAPSNANGERQSQETDGNESDREPSDAAPAASSAKKKPRVFTYTAPSGNVYTVQHRQASTIRTQEEFTWIMQYYAEYRSKAGTGKGKNWLNENILPGFVARFGARGLSAATLSRVSDT
ncbi:hypothetical protein BOTBODRAFT_177532 [Botryobasidium botryosum FD-172 SS1]|uniref:Uncharacterized protein n=1 Tax=Botryobasidium botryosum (strain FD-172 SS1) TaxID=930990 RepID=A0A067MGN1_BOTB1|nr:hypothetical protein BOTBODRAFT_177532 [Botryobasidium botryosum FD-172 SS1]